MNKSAILARKFQNTAGIVLIGDVIVKWEVSEHPLLPTDAEIEMWRQEVNYIEITATQFLRALSAAGHRQTVDAYVASSQNQDLKDLYYRSATFRSNNPLLIQTASALGLSAADIQAVFSVGLSIV